MSQHLAEQRVAPVPSPRRRPVEPGEELLHASELSIVLGIVGDVELAAQHPLSHLAHIVALYP
ncbi:MAG TPA: hypothetical protein VFP78_20950 [Solirubrobacteraceae bacterium]|nr:hypothetical protein [Solirubrobacteraceae bacterium]